MKNKILLVAVVFLTLAVTAERQPFDRYQSVVDRQMFGPPPEGFDPTKPPSEAQSAKAAQKIDAEKAKEQEKLKSAIHFSMINVTPAGETAVGFTDSSDSKNPINYYLKVGEERNGWLVKEADATAGTMTVAKGEIEVELSLGGNSAKGAGKTSSAKAVAAAPNMNGPMGSLRARRHALQAERREKEEKDARRMEDLLKKMEERDAANAKRMEEQRAQLEQERTQREQERASQRESLLKIQEELKRAREAKQKADEDAAQNPPEEKSEDAAE